MVARPRMEPNLQTDRLQLTSHQGGTPGHLENRSACSWERPSLEVMPRQSAVPMANASGVTVELASSL